MLFGYCFRTPCLLVRRHVRRSASSSPARSRTPMRSLQSRHAPLALAPRMIVSRRALPPFVWKKHCPPLTRRYCMWIALLAFVRYGHTAISSRIDGIAAPGYTAACSLARILHFACDPQVAILQAHCMTPPGDSRTPAQPLTLRLDRMCPMVQSRQQQGCDPSHIKVAGPCI